VEFFYVNITLRASLVKEEGLKKKAVQAGEDCVGV